MYYADQGGVTCSWCGMQFISRMQLGAHRRVCSACTGSTTSNSDSESADSAVSESDCSFGSDSADSESVLSLSESPVALITQPEIPTTIQMLARRATMGWGIERSVPRTHSGTADTSVSRARDYSAVCVDAIYSTMN
jgi:hypothetical protein